MGLIVRVPADRVPAVPIKVTHDAVRRGLPIKDDIIKGLLEALQTFRPLGVSRPGD